MLKDLLEPGFPHIIKGSLNRIQINSEKIFSHKPLFLAKPMFPSKTILVKNKLSFSRQFYNDTVTIYNTKLQAFPSNIIAGMFNFTRSELFKTDEASRQNVKVDFGN